MKTLFNWLEILTWNEYYKNRCIPLASNQQRRWQASTLQSETWTLYINWSYLRLYEYNILFHWKFTLENSIQKWTHATSFEPAKPSVDAWHDISRICDYMKTTFIRLQFIWKVFSPKKMARASRINVTEHILMIIQKYIIY